jgi:hypothetical protein
MSLAPKWAKPAAILGLQMQLIQIKLTVKQMGLSDGELGIALLEEELKTLEGMKD